MRTLIFLNLLFWAFSVWCKVNINTATATEIADELNGIGQQKAEAIVAYRKTHGPFQSLDDLDAVTGIGPKIIQKNKEQIVLK